MVISLLFKNNLSCFLKANSDRSLTLHLAEFRIDRRYAGWNFVQHRGGLADNKKAIKKKERKTKAIDRVRTAQLKLADINRKP